MTCAHAWPGRREPHQGAVRTEVVTELTQLVDEEMSPDRLVSAEMSSQLQNVIMRLQQQGIGLDDYLRVIGQDQGDFLSGLKAPPTASRPTLRCRPSWPPSRSSHPRTRSTTPSST